MNNIGNFLRISLLVLLLIGWTIPVFGINDEKKDTIILDYSFSLPILEKTDVKKEIYDRIRIDGLSNTNDVGIPCLPVKPVKIMLPQGKDVEEIRVITSEEKNLGTGFKIEVGAKLIPIFSNHIVINNDIPSRIYTKQFSTSLFEKKGIYNCRGFDILHVNLYPIQYCSDNGKLSYFENMKIIVETKESKINRAFRGLEADYLVVQNIVDNPNTIETYKTISPVNPVFLEQYDYVIITNDDLKNSNGDYTFQDLLSYKESVGLTANIVTVEWIIDNPDFSVFGPWGDANPDNPFYESDITGNLEYFDNPSARIRNFIRFAYTEWGTQYILLGGDADEIVPMDNIIPLRGLFANESGLPLNGLLEEEEDDIPSDVYYACLDGNYNYDCDEHFGECADRNEADPVDEADLYSEVYVGRACVDSEEEVSNFVMKTLNYAQSGGEYLSKILFIGEYLGSAFYTPWGGDYKDEVESYIPFYYNLEKLYDRDDPYQNWDPYNLVNRLSSDPVQFINHDGHGNENYILKMYAHDIRTLTNDRHFFIYSHSCLTGSFDNWNCWYGYVEEDCIAEILTAELEYGAYACILNARYGLGSEDTIESPSGALDESFLKALFTKNIRELGPANHYSKEDNIWRIDENGIRWCYYQTNLFGDPHLSIKDPNLPPNKPDIDGPTQVSIGETHEYTIFTTDPEDDDLYYQVDIDGGTGGQWYGPYNSGAEIVVNITFPKKGYITIYAKAKDIKGAVSETVTLEVKVPRIRAFNNYYLQYILNRFQTLLPFISYLLRL